MYYYPIGPMPQYTAILHLWETFNGAGVERSTILKFVCHYLLLVVADKFYLRDEENKSRQHINKL